ncbi:MAG: ParM/StbA family protein [Massilibacteroides sp.]|nr:ParM/StbA family protein [Massilibacteroides sp.]MDD4660332.1 ParM/StbA family protein [Massilibacteroides sp.]
MYEIQLFSSLVENNNTILSQTSRDLLHGLRIQHDDKWYICGDLALNEGQSPHKLINSSPEDTDYQLLAKAAMLLIQDKVEQPITITTGFPYSTYYIYREKAIEFFQRTHLLDYDASTFNAGNKKKVVLEVQKVDVIPEIVGCTIALRKGEEKASGSFFVLSCGFGTFESILSTDSGIIEQAMVSTHGIRYAVNLMINELRSKYYLELRNTHQFDVAFQKGYVFLNRKNIDLRELRRNAIQTYYNEVISPNLRSVINDANLMKTNRIYLCGGAMYYQDLIDCFNNEFGSFTQISVLDNPDTLASRGYALNSLRMINGKGQSAVGIDIGNATTVVTSFSSENPAGF